MEDITRNEIARLRESGLGYKAIAKRLSLSPNSVKSVIKRGGGRKCEQCGKQLQGKQERFCCPTCRTRWWNANREHATKVCPHCGKAFIPKDERRVYCSPRCFYASRRKGDVGEE